MSLYKKLEKYVEERFDTPDSVIYHYTNCGEKIFKSKYFKLSAHSKLNAKNNRELVVGSNIVRKKLKGHPHISDLLPKFNDYIKNRLRVYTGSFCEEKNCRYAIKKYGKECIGFDVQFINEFCKNNHAMLGKVKYNRKEQEEIISGIFDIFDSSSEKYLPSLFLFLTITFPLFKQRCDRWDKECRIVVAEIMSPDDSTELISNPIKKKFDFCMKNVVFHKKN